MKVLMSGGALTQNIINGIEKKFRASGVDFIVVPLIQDIESIYSRGDYFDRAIIIEQSWTDDYKDRDESSWRSKINTFANECSNRLGPGMTLVFLSQTKESASIVYEEIFPILQSSIVVVKPLPYKASFFASLIGCDLDRFPEEIVYKPDEEEMVQNDDFDDFDDSNNLDDDLGIGTEEEFQPSGDIPLENFDPNFDTGYGGLDIPEQQTEEEGTDAGLGFVDTPWDNNDNFSTMETVDDTQDTSADTSFDGEMGDPFSVEYQPNNSNQDISEQYPSEDIPLDNDFGYDTNEYDNQNNGFGNQDDFNTQDGFGVQNNFDTAQSDMDYGPSGFGDDDYQPNIYNNEYGQNQSSDFDYDNDSDDTYERTEEVQRVNMSDDQVKAALQAFASRGNSIVVTGCGGCGTSTLAFNLANTLCNLGYTVLLVDMDTQGRTQSYISKDNYDSMDPDGANLIAAVNSSTGINAHMSIVRTGFHLLTMGMAGDLAEPDKLLHKQKLMRFTSNAKNGHNFVIYDIPFNYAIDFFSEVLYMCDNIVLTIDASNWGVTKTLMNVCNIQSDEMQETFFNRAQIVFNKFRGNNKFFGKKVKNIKNITKEMDNKVVDLLGEEPEYSFRDMHIAGVINDDVEFESGWYNRKQYSDTRKGQPIFIELIKNIVLKR